MNPEATPRKKQPWLPVGGLEARIVIVGFL